MDTVLLTSSLLLIILLATSSANSQTVYGCYGPPDQHCSHHTLACGHGEVIAFEFEELNHPISFEKKSPSTQCLLSKGDACTSVCCQETRVENSTMPRYKLPPGIASMPTTTVVDDYDNGNEDDEDDDESLKVKMSDIISIHNNCSIKQSCNVTSPQVSTAPNGFDFVKYSYICIQESRIYNMLKKRTFKKRSIAYLYASGKDLHRQPQEPMESKVTPAPVEPLTCTCEIKSQEEITMYSTYINLGGDSCRKIRISSQDHSLFNCTDDGVTIFYEILFYSKEPIFIDLTQLTMAPDDVVWLEFFANSEFIDVSCSGCGDSWNGEVGSSGNSVGINTWTIFNLIPLYIVSALF